LHVVAGARVIAMELADKSLHDTYVECQTAGLVGIPRDDLLRYVRDAAEALDHMNEKHNLQHLDVKPRNLFVVADRVKVADFGLVKQLERSSTSGFMGGVTPIYAAPETFQNKISKHSDQYSLAIVYVELLTGLRPFAGKNIRQLALQHMTEPPDLAMLPEADRAEVDESHFLAVTAVQREVGVLRPTVLIGVGSFGRRALQEVRCRLIDRVGDVAQVPAFRFLYVDCDPDALNKAVAAPTDVALSP